MLKSIAMAVVAALAIFAWLARTAPAAEGDELGRSCRSAFPMDLQAQARCVDDALNDRR